MLCGCPPSPPFFFSRPLLSLLLRCFWSSRFVAADPPFFVPVFFLFLFLFSPSLFAGCHPAVPLTLAPFGSIFIFLPGAPPSVWCVGSALLLVSCSVPHLVVWCHSLVWAVLCGSSCFSVVFGAVLCRCAVALLFVVLSFCVVGSFAGRLSLALAAPSLLVSCVHLLCHVVLCAVSSCVPPTCVAVWWFFLCRRVVSFCAVSSSRLVRCVLLRCVGFVRLSCSAPPPLSLPLPSGTLLLPDPLWLPVVVLCTGVPCCVVLLCHLSCLVLLSASFPAVWCSVASFALGGAVRCCLLFLDVRCWVWLSTVVL